MNSNIDVDKLNKLLDLILDSVLKDLPDLKQIGLTNGQIGIAIFLYELGSYRVERELIELADSFLDEVYQKVDEYNSLDFDNGILGIGVALRYLFLTKRVVGEIDEVLQEIDDNIIYDISFKEQLFKEDSSKSFSDLIDVSLYLVWRYKDTEGTELNYFYSECLIQAVNYMSLTLESLDVNFKEPLIFDLKWSFTTYLFLLAFMMNNKIYEYKVRKIIDVLLSEILSLYPIVDSHKVLMYCVLAELNINYKSIELKKHMNRLISDININEVIVNEFSNKSLSVRHGVMGFLFLLERFGSYTKTDIFAYRKLIANKVCNSALWNELTSESKDEIGLIEGFAGIGLGVINLIKNNKD